ncbi:MAG: hypothetical protein PsegKO_33010 [Pseudohongiellaceae bacterium]
MASLVKRISVFLGMDDRDFRRKLGAAKRDMRGFARSLGDLNAAVTGSATRIAAGVAAGAAIATSAVASSISKAAEFDEKLSNVAAKSGATAEQMKLLEAQARQMGRETSFTAAEAADAMGFLAQAGFDVQEIMNALPATLSLAAAGQLDLARAADIASNVVGQFGLAAKDTARVADVMAAGASNSNTSVEQMAEALNYAGPAANAFGASLEETVALIGKLGDNGLQGSNAGTALRSMFLRLAAPPKEAGEAIAALGIRTVDASGKMRSMGELLEEIGGQLKKKGDIERYEQAINGLGVATRDAGGKLRSASDVLEDINTAIAQTRQSGAALSAFEAMGINVQSANGDMRKATDILVDLGAALNKVDQNKRLEYINAIFGKTAVSGGISAITGALSGDLQELEAKLQNSAGAAQSMAAIMRDNLKGDLKLLNSATDDVQITLGKMFTEPARGLVKTLAGLANNVQEFLVANEAEVKAWVGRVGEFLSSLARDAGVIFKALAAGDLMGSLDGLKLENGWIKDLIRGLQQAGQMAKAFWDVTRQVWEVAMKAVRFLGPELTAMLVVFKLAGGFQVLGAVIGVLTSVFSLLGSVVGVVWAIIFSPIGLILAALALFGAAVWLVIDNWELLGPVVAGVWQWIREAVQSFIDWFKETFPELALFLGKVWDQIKETALLAWEIVKAGIEGIIKGIRLVFSAFWDWFKGHFPGLATELERIAETIKLAFGIAADWIRKKFEDVFSWITKTYRKVKGWVSDLADRAGNLDIVGKIKGAFGGDRGGGDGTDGAVKLARGGQVRGPGGATADKIRAWLSDGEFVANARSVRFWGADTFDALNRRQMPDVFSGLVNSVISSLAVPQLQPALVLGDDASQAGPSDRAPLVLDGVMYPLEGPADVVDALERALTRKERRSRAGRPRWR